MHATFKAIGNTRNNKSPSDPYEQFSSDDNSELQIQSEIEKNMTL